jgi:hypothetical protein
MKRPKKGITEKYLNVLIEIHDSLRKDERSSINEMCRKHKVSCSISTAIRELHLIRYSLNGNRWIGDYPTLEMVDQVRELIASKAPKKPIKQVQQAFEWEKPQPKAEPIVNYEYKPQPDTSLVSEFIDHHEQSLLPNIQSVVKTDENVKSERLFQLRIFGINLFTVKY